MRNHGHRPRRSTPRGFNATALQVRRAYEKHFGRSMPGDMTYVAAGNELVKVMGLATAQAFVLAQSNDPTIPD